MDSDVYLSDNVYDWGSAISADYLVDLFDGSMDSDHLDGSRIQPIQKAGFWKLLKWVQASGISDHRRLR